MARKQVLPDIVVGSVGTETVKRLKARAKQNGRSFQNEVKIVLKEGGEGITWQQVRVMAEELRRILAGWQFPDSAELLRVDRER